MHKAIAAAGKAAAGGLEITAKTKTKVKAKPMAKGHSMGKR